MHNRRPPRAARRPIWGGEQCEVAHTRLAFSLLAVETAKWVLVLEVDMAQQPASLALRFGVVLALAVIILVGMTLAAPPQSSDPIYRPQHLLLY